MNKLLKKVIPVATITMTLPTAANTVSYIYKYDTVEKKIEIYDTCLHTIDTFTSLVDLKRNLDNERKSGNNFDGLIVDTLKSTGSSYDQNGNRYYGYILILTPKNYTEGKYTKYIGSLMVSKDGTFSRTEVNETCDTFKQSVSSALIEKYPNFKLVELKMNEKK